MLPLLKKRTLDLNTGDHLVTNLNFMLDVCEWMEQLLQAKLDNDTMKSLSSKLAVASVTILLVWYNNYLVIKLDDSNIVNENGIPSVGEDVKSYRVVWGSCRLVKCSWWMMNPFELDNCWSVEQVRTAVVLLDEGGMWAIKKLVEDSFFIAHKFSFCKLFWNLLPFTTDAANKHVLLSNTTDVSFLAGQTLVRSGIVLIDIFLSSELRFRLFE